MPGTASYQMYSWPKTRDSASRFWHLIRAAYGSGNRELTDFADPQKAWSDPDLLLSQTCGLPFRYRLKEQVGLLGTLDYGVTDCPPGYYRSCLIVRRYDPRKRLANFADAKVARNSIFSQSGWAALETHLDETGADFRLRGNVVETGSHAASLRAVAEGRADLASIDAITFRFLNRYDASVGKVRVLTRTRPTPGLPLITGRGVDPAPLFDAVAKAISSLSENDRDTLGIKGIHHIPKDAYLAEPLPYPLTPL